jgi:ATP phosphoribosyltransferase regulatory subunit HisZ
MNTEYDPAKSDEFHQRLTHTFPQPSQLTAAIRRGDTSTLEELANTSDLQKLIEGSGQATISALENTINELEKVVTLNKGRKNSEVNLDVASEIELRAAKFKKNLLHKTRI